MAKSKGTNTSNKVGVHPMIPVPQALKQVLTCTATALSSQTDTDIDAVGSETLDLFPMIPNANDQSSSSPIVGRIAAETIKAPSPGYPPYNASIMDGYAISTLNIKTSSSSQHPSQRFACKGRIHAGPQNPQGLDLITKSCFSTITTVPSSLTGPSTTTRRALPNASYVTTGAVIPSCYNAVIPLEQVILLSSNDNDNGNGRDDSDDDHTPDRYIDISWDVLKATTLNKWIRPIGCDIPPDTIIVTKGDTINAIQLGLLIQCSISAINVRCLPKVSLLSTGNELVSSSCSSNIHRSTNLQHGQIPDINRPVLRSILSGYKSNTITDYGIQSDDDADQLERTLKIAVENSHVVITTGGISMGEKDIVEQVLVERLDCSIQFGRLHMKPGKPTTFGTIQKSNGSTCLVFCLPGNPVSACVCSELLVRPCLDMLHCGLLVVASSSPAGTVAVGQSPSQSVVESIGNARVLHSEVLATLGKSVKLDVERPEYCRVQLTYRINNEGHGEYVALSTGVQRSSRLMSMSGADGLMVLPKGIIGEKEFAEAGEKFLVLLLRREGGAAGVHNAITLHDSLHFKKAPFTIAILQVIGDNKDLHQRRDSDVDAEGKIRDAMDPNNFRVIQKVDIHHKDFTSDILLKSKFLKCMDVIMVVCTNTGFQVDLEVASTIRSCIVKEADAMSYQMRKGAALDRPVSVLFDSVVGHLPLNGATPLLLSMSDEGIDGALNNVKVLLKRALITAQK